MDSSRPIDATAGQQAVASVAVPHCPQCGSGMIVRALKRGEEVEGLYWGCRHELVCSGTRRIRNPDSIQPLAHDASIQAIYEWQRAREQRGPERTGRGGAGAPGVNIGIGGLAGRLGAVLARPKPTWAQETVDPASLGPLDGLEDHGFVILHDRRVSSARAVVDHLVVGPTGVFVVDRKAWPGQISTTAENIYVDGRLRTGATDQVNRAVTAVEQTLGHELKPLGATVRGVISFERATNRLFEANVDKLMLCGSRALAKAIRRGQPTLGPETVVRLAVAADRLLG